MSFSRRKLELYNILSHRSETEAQVFWLAQAKIFHSWPCNIYGLPLTAVSLRISQKIALSLVVLFLPFLFFCPSQWKHLNEEHLQPDWTGWSDTTLGIFQRVLSHVMGAVTDKHQFAWPQRVFSLGYIPMVGSSFLLQTGLLRSFYLGGLSTDNSFTLNSRLALLTIKVRGDLWSLRLWQTAQGSAANDKSRTCCKKNIQKSYSY